MTMPSSDRPSFQFRRFESIDRPACHWVCGSVPVNVSILLSILRRPVTFEEDVLLRRLFLVRILEREVSKPDDSRAA